MDQYILMGTKKHGLLLDNKESQLIIYEYLSLYERLKKKKQVLNLNYSEIKSIKICYGLSTGVRFDAAQITLEITTMNNVLYDVPLTYNNTKIDNIRSFITILRDSHLTINDPYNILEQILITKLDLIDFIKKIAKEAHSKRL